MSTSSNSSETSFCLPKDLRLAFDEAQRIIENLQSFPVDVKFFVAFAIGSVEHVLQPGSVTFRRHDRELLEELYNTFIGDVCSKVPDSTNTYSLVVNDVRMTVEKRQRKKVQCPYCSVYIVHLKRHMDKCPQSRGKYCTNCNTFVAEDFLTHTLACRTRKYSCSSCNTAFLNASTLRSHQRTCNQRDRIGDEVRNNFNTFAN